MAPAGRRPGRRVEPRRHPRPRHHRALDLPPAPTERIALVLATAGAKNLEFFGADLSGISLVASDADVTLGDGAPVHATAKDILLGVTGRRPLPQ